MGIVTAREDLDAPLAAAIAILRQGYDLGPGIDQAVRGRLERSSRRPYLLGAIAVAAGLTGLLVLPLTRGTGTRVPFALVAAGASDVALVGDFNNWSPRPLERVSSNGRWRTTIVVPPGRYRYSYLVDGHTWIPDPLRAPAVDPDFDAPTSLLIVGDGGP